MRFRCIRETWFLGKTFQPGDPVELDYDPTLPTNEKGEPDPKGKGKPINRHFERVADDYGDVPEGPDEIAELKAQNAELLARLEAVEQQTTEKTGKK